MAFLRGICTLKGQVQAAKQAKEVLGKVRLDAVVVRRPVTAPFQLDKKHRTTGPVLLRQLLDMRQIM